MLHKLALGIMAQPGACKHTYKIMLSGRPSRMMSGGPSVRMSRCLSVMISRCLSVMKSGSPSMMVSGGPSMRMFGRLAVMMSGGPSMRMFGRLSVMMSESSSVMMFGRLAVMMSGGPLMRMFGRLSMMMSEIPSMRMFGCLSGKFFGQSSKKISEQSSKNISRQSSKKISERFSKKISRQSSEKISERSSKKISKRFSKKISGRSSKKISERFSKEISGRSSKKISKRSSKKISERSSKKISERFSKEISGRSSKKISKRSSKKISVQSPIKISEQFSKKISGRSLEKISERPSEKISGHNNEEFQEQKPDSEGYTGLENQGATCYLNTVLQILFMTEEFREAVEGYKPHNCNSNLNNHLAQLFKHLKSGDRNTATTEGITTELKINVHKQEDAAKCLQKILNMVNPEISKIFQGTMVDKTICKTPAKHHEPLKQVKTFFIISISLESQDHINTQSCFESYFAPIIMSGEDQQIYCKECEMMMDTEIICSLQKVPSVLVLHLERFELDFDTTVKNESSVEIPPQLLVIDEDGVNHTYDLYAIANHVGSLNGGHYYADIRSFEDQQWYRFNDSSVRQMCDLKCDLDKPLLSDEAYLLLYKKIS